MADFDDFKYEMDGGDVCLIRLDADEASASGAEPTGAVTLDIHALVGGGRRRFGIHPRGVSLAREFEVGDDVGNKYKFLPVFTQTALDAAGFAPKSTVTIGSTDWTVVRRISETLV